jgi:hypothetical protein
MTPWSEPPRFVFIGRARRELQRRLRRTRKEEAMPEGTHWEWRGFGRVSDAFAVAFARLTPIFEARPAWDVTRDDYLFVDGCTVNVKLRTGGTQQGLKLKRLVGSEAGLELWSEDPKELYRFRDVDASVLAKLADILGLTLEEDLLPGNLGPQQILDCLGKASPPALVVSVHKKRQSRLARAGVQVELAELRCVTIDGREVDIGSVAHSVGIENTSDLRIRSTAELGAAANAVRHTLADLAIADEALFPMNYLEAIALWTTRPEAHPGGRGGRLAAPV